jgi:hypothetical protein
VAQVEGQESLRRLELLGRDAAVGAGMGVETFVGAPEGVEQVEDRVAGEELVARRDRVGPVRPIRPRTATAMRGSAATRGRPRIVPMDSPQ